MDPSPVSPPVALTIAGSDCSAGAGLQADLKTFGALGVYGLTAVTCVVAEVPGRVETIHPLPAELVAEQVRLLFQAFPVGAVKTGMLPGVEIIGAVASELDRLESPPPLVVDPVMVATSGDRLVSQEAVDACRTLLFPRAVLLTPNVDELQVLTGREVADAASLRTAAVFLSEMHGCAVLAKGGHLRGEEALDLLVQGREVTEMRSFHIGGVKTHGTGCTISAAVAAALARGRDLPAAVREAKHFVTQSIQRICRWKNIDALNHPPLK